MPEPITPLNNPSFTPEGDPSLDATSLPQHLPPRTLKRLKHKSAENPQEALTEALELQEIYPDNSYLRSLIATNMQRVGRLEEALSLALRCREERSQDTSTWTLLGQIYAELGRGIEAAESWKQAILLDPKRIYVLQERIRSTLGHEADSIIQSLYEALDAHSTSGQISLQMLHIKAYSNSLEENIEILPLLIQAEPTDLMHRTRLAMRYIEKKEFELSLQTVLEIIEINPYFVKGYELLSTIALRRFNCADKTIAALEKGTSLLPQNTKLPELLANNLLFAGFNALDQKDFSKGKDRFESASSFSRHHASLALIGFIAIDFHNEQISYIPKRIVDLDLQQHALGNQLAKIARIVLQLFLVNRLGFTSNKNEIYKLFDSFEELSSTQKGNLFVVALNAMIKAANLSQAYDFYLRHKASSSGSLNA